MQSSPPEAPSRPLGLVVDQELYSQFGGVKHPIKKFTQGQGRPIPYEDWVKMFGPCKPERFFDPQEGKQIDKYYNMTGAWGHRWVQRCSDGPLTVEGRVVNSEKGTRLLVVLRVVFEAGPPKKAGSR